MGVRQRPERDKYHTYWRFRLPMLLNTILKKGLHRKYKYQQYICRWPNFKNRIQTCCSFRPVTWIYK